MDAILKVEHLCKRYNDFELNDVSFSLPAGAILGLIGENGAGKTTILSLILGLVHRDDGEVTLFGEPGADITAREEIGVVFDECHFHEMLRVKNVKAILGVIYKNWDDALFCSLCTRFGLEMNKTVKELSRGMKMKLSIAAALAHHPRLLLLDEATSGLDPVVRSEILDLLLDFIQDETHSVLFSSHITSDLEHAADYVAYLHEGRLLFCRQKDELLDAYGVIRCGADAFDRLDPEDVASYRKNEFGYAVLTANRPRAKAKYRELVVDRASIEDIMVLYGKGEAK